MRTKPTLISLLKFLITAAVIWWLLDSITWQQFKSYITRAHYGWVLAGILLFVLSIVLGAWQWHIILYNRKVFLPFTRALRIYFIGIFFNNVALGFVAGDASKIAYLHLDKQNAKAGLAATLLDRLAGLMALCVFAIIGSIFIFTMNIQQNKQLYMVLGALGFFCLLLFGVFLFILSRRLHNFAKSIMAVLPGFWGKGLLLNIFDVVALDRRGNDKKMLLKVIVLSCLIQSMRITMHMLCAQALGIFHPGMIQYFLVIIPITALLMVVPLPFGARETAGGILFSMAGFSLEDTVIMEFLASLSGTLASLAGGVFFLINPKKRSSVTNGNG